MLNVQLAEIRIATTPTEMVFCSLEPFLGESTA